MVRAIDGASSYSKACRVPEGGSREASDRQRRGNNAATEAISDALFCSGIVPAIDTIMQPTSFAGNGVAERTRQCTLVFGIRNAVLQACN